MKIQVYLERCFGKMTGKKLRTVALKCTAPVIVEPGSLLIIINLTPIKDIFKPD